MPESTPEVKAEVPSTPKSTPTSPKSKKNSGVIIAIIVAVLIVGGFIAYQNGMFSKTDTDDTTKNSEEVVDGVTADKAAATINGVNIMLSDVQSQASALIASSGVTEVTPEMQQQALQQSLQILVNQEILYQTAINSGISADQSKIQEAIDEIVARFPSNDEYQAALAADGLTESLLRDSIAKQLVVESYVESVIDVESIESTEEEVQALYDQYAAVQDNMPEIDEIYTQLEAEVKQNKINAELGVIVKQLLDSADFKVL